jgi:hypothetical protein
LEGLDGVLEDGFDGLHDTESSFHLVDLWLHAFDGLHLSGDLNEGLSIIESLEDSGSEGLLDVLDGSGLGNGGIGITTGLGGESGGEGGLEVDVEVIFVHGVVSVGSNGSEESSGELFSRRLLQMLSPFGLFLQLLSRSPVCSWSLVGQLSRLQRIYRTQYLKLRWTEAHMK